MVKFRIPKGGNSLKSKNTTLDFRRVDFGHFSHMLGKVP